MTIQLGDRVKDPVSGFQGIAISSHTYMHGCTRISVQPPIGEDGKLPDAHAFDEPALVIVEAQAVSVSPVASGQRTGGPDKYPDTPRR